MVLQLLPQLALLGLAFVGVNGQVAQDCRYSQYIPPDGRYYSLYNSNYPNNYRPGSQCYYYMYTDPGYVVDLTCNPVIMPSNGISCLDYLTIYGSNFDNSYCANFNVRSLNQKLLLEFVSAYSSRGGTFFCNVRVIRRQQVTSTTLRPNTQRCDCGWSFKTKVVGGENVLIHEFPMMASLINVRTRRHACGATIISPNYVMTAAHCLDTLTVSLTGVLVGEHDLSTGMETNSTKLHKARRFIYHPNWNRVTTKDDIALVEVVGPIQFSTDVGTACLPFNLPNVPSPGQNVTVLGWGTTSFGGPVAEVLQKAVLTVVPIQRCQQAFNSSDVSNSQICTYEAGKDSCQMDSGGPLLSKPPGNLGRWFITGIVSYGAACAGNVPSVSTRVYNYLDWIVQTTRETFCVP